MTTGKKAPRRAERALAFKVLYGLEFSPATSEEALWKAYTSTPDQAEQLQSEASYAWHLVKGIWKKRQVLDTAIAGFSQNWKVERLGKVEAAILRIAFFELMEHDRDVPPKVAINEAVELSKQYSDDRSKGFVNGILDAAAKAAEAGTLGTGA